MADGAKVRTVAEVMTRDVLSVFSEARSTIASDLGLGLNSNAVLRALSPGLARPARAGLAVDRLERLVPRVEASPGGARSRRV